MSNRIYLVILAAITAILAGCAIPYPMQSGSFSGVARDPVSGSVIQFGGNGSTGGGTTIINNGGAMPYGLSCPAGSFWDGRGCRVTNPAIINGGGYRPWYNCPQICGNGVCRCQ